jgi:hypothetical protein
MEDTMESTYRILDIEFNAAVAHLADKTARGFRVAEVAPQTYEEVIRQIDRHGIIVVWSGASEHTIFGHPGINYAFRAWHDWCHWRGGHDFSPSGEIAVAHMQREQLIALYGDTPRTRRWCKIIEAEIIGQIGYREQHSEFPVNQYAFVVDYLNAHTETSVP